ncbi:hypothetical protein BVX98_02110 [bacterium F11]|nr:hypothetical protein BVX98_02110 [bacterium F11]
MESSFIPPKDTPEFYNFQGIAHQMEGEYAAAVAQFDKAIEMNPGYVEAYNNRGVNRFKLGDVDEAEADFSKVIEMDPNHFDGLYNRAFLYKKTERLDKALQDFSKAREISPNEPQAYYMLADTHFFMNDFDRALECINQAISLNPKNENKKNCFYYSLRGAINEQRKDWENALADLNKYIVLEPSDPWGYQMRGYIHLEMGNSKKGLKDCQSALKHAPLNWPNRSEVENWIKDIESE